jgi:tellurium resistance protein TerD
MAVSLVKGGNISLTKSAINLRHIVLGLGWDARSTFGIDFDLDASVFLVQANGRVRGDHDFIFYNQLKSICSSVEHTGDNLTGDGEGDDESVKVDLERVPPEIVKIVVAVTIHDAAMRQQNFGMVQNAFIRVVNQADGVELVRYDLSEDYSTETAMIFGEVYRHNGEWKFRAVGQGFAGGLAALAINYGVEVA